MDESPGQIEDHIRSTRGALEGNLQELEHRVKDATNWRVQFRRHPSVFLGAAFAGGMLLAAALVPSSHPSERARSPGRDRRGQPGGNRVKWELLAMAAAQLGALVGKALPLGQLVHKGLRR